MSKVPDFIGSYRVARFIRSGNSTQIYEAIKDDDGGRYVLKILRTQYWGNKEEIGYLKHEYEVAGGLNHPNIIRVLEFHTEGRLAYLVLERFTERNIKQVFQDQGLNVIWVEFPKIVEQSLTGLHHLHEQGWVHCDVKPDNFLLNENSDVKLIDFAIAQKATRGKMSAWFRKRGQIRGTRSYMSPEQIRGEALDPRADIYSFACVIFELLAGKVPYSGVNPNDLLNRHLKAPIPTVQVQNDNVTPQMADLLQRMMAKAPEQRPASMMDVLKEFKVLRPFRSAPRPPEPTQKTDGG